MKRGLLAVRNDNIKSPPTRGRGLKLPDVNSPILGSFVAPHAGAWIETLHPLSKLPYVQVAPHAGAWIETIDD